MAEPLVFEFNLGTARTPAAPDPEQAMRILVMGDFSGRASRGIDERAGLGARVIRQIDLDNMEHAPGRLSCALEVALDGPDAAPVRIDFRGYDDFHPDQLYRMAGLFEAPAHQQSTAVETAAANTPASANETAHPFAQLLGGEMRRPAAGPAPSPVGGDGLAAFVKSIVGPITVTDPLHAQAVAAATAWSGERMRTLLHDPAFRQLEAAWRSLHLLITSLELDERLQVHLLDVSKQELQADLEGVGADLAASGLYQLLVEQPRQSPDSAPWSVLVGDYRFDNGPHDMALLGALGAIAAHAGAPFLATPDDTAAADTALAVEPDTAPVADSDGDAARWSALRHSGQACWIGLAMPQLLLRLPYGKKTDRVESFEFEELTGLPSHHDYLWGNAAFGCALLLGRSFEQRGWDMEAGDHLEIADLPAHTWQRDGEAQLQACGGRFLSERAGAEILQHGAMPLLSYKNRNAVRLLRFQSIADPVQPLCGPWQD